MMITTALLFATLLSTPATQPTETVGWYFKNQAECAIKARELNDMFARFKRDLNDGEGDLILVECQQQSTGLTITPSASK